MISDEEFIEAIRIVHEYSRQCFQCPECCLEGYCELLPCEWDVKVIQINSAACAERKKARLASRVKK